MVHDGVVREVDGIEDLQFTFAAWFSLRNPLDLVGFSFGQKKLEVL